MIALYNRTVRRVGIAHRLVRIVVWHGGEAIVRGLIAVRRFEVPAERLLPLYKIELLVGAYERDTVRVCEKLIGPGAVVVDVGAHVGYFTNVFSRLAGAAGRVFAFEPHPANFQILLRNLRRRRIANVTAVQMAVSSGSGQATLYATPLSMGHSLLDVKAYVERVPVATVSLDGFFSAHGIERVDLVKIDAEGGEADVLEGMRRRAGRPEPLSVILEFKPSILVRQGRRPVELLERLFALGFAVYAIGRGGVVRPVSAAAAEQFASSGETQNLLALTGPLPSTLRIESR